MMSLDKMDPLIADLQEKTEDNSWRCQNQKILLTYTSHIDKIDLEMFITEIHACKFIRSAHETGETGHLHTHCLIDFGKTFQSKNVRIFDWKDLNENKWLHPNIKFVKTKKHWENCTQYLGKQDVDNSDLLVENNWINVLKDKKTLAEAVLGANKPTDVMGIIAAYKLLNRPEIEVENITLRPWQIKIVEMIERPVDRSVIWIYDNVGGMGKSTFAGWLADVKPDNVFYTDGLGGKRDGATVIAGHLTHRPNMDTVVLDLPRNAEFHSIYEILECLKNGRCTTTKYEGASVKFKKCHIVVMANFLPDVTKLSMDRWRIYSGEDMANIAPLTLVGAAGFVYDRNEENILTQHNR